MTIPIYPPIFLFSIPPLSYGKHFHPRKWSFSRQVTSTKLSRALSWILEVKFPSIGNVHRWEPPSRKRWEFISRARSVFQAIHRHGSRSIENSVARAEMDANKSIGFSEWNQTSARDIPPHRRATILLLVSLFHAASQAKRGLENEK